MPVLRLKLMPSRCCCEYRACHSVQALNILMSYALPVVDPVERSKRIDCGSCSSHEVWLSRLQKELGDQYAKWQ